MVTNSIIERDFKEFLRRTKRKDCIGDIIVIKARGLKNCNLNISISNKLSDPEYGIVKVKFRPLYYDEYKVPLGDETNFDTLIVIGLNKDKDIIETAFAIPEKELNGKRFITITKTGIYQKFKIDERPYREVYDHMKTGNYSIICDDRMTIMRYNDVI